MRIIFLDIDGVLNNMASISDGIELLSSKVLLIDQLCKDTGAKVVISSCWGKLFDFEAICWGLRWTGLRSKPIDVTPRHDDKPRGYEIQQWLKQHGASTYVILDDSSDMLPSQKKNFVQTSEMLGLTRKNVGRAKEILMKDDGGK